MFEDSAIDNVNIIRNNIYYKEIWLTHNDLYIKVGMTVIREVGAYKYIFLYVKMAN